MRIAVFSDMHGNAIALDAVLADFAAKPGDQLICLGDAIQGGPQPREVVARLRGLGCPVVMGNADDWLLSGQASDAESIDDKRQRRLDAVRLWSLAQLSEADRTFIQNFRPTVELALGDRRKLLGYHGSPKSFDDVIVPSTPDETVQAWLEPDESIVYAGGHTHIQFVRHFGRTFHFNPGSVGFAYRHDQDERETFRADPWAEYAIVSIAGARSSLEFCRVPFDLQALLDAYQSSGRPFVEDAIHQYRG